MLIGGGELQNELKKQIVEMGLKDDTCCLNWQENIFDYFQVMDVFCLPSLFEGLAITSVEAQAAGLKCFLSDTISMEAKITNLGVFLPLEEEIWAEQLAHSVSEERRERKDVEIEKAGYDIRTAVKKLEQMYE